MKLKIGIPMAETDITKFLAEQQALEDTRKKLIDDLLKQKAAAVKDFDDKLAKLGYAENGASKRSHHKKTAPAAAPEKKG